MRERGAWDEYELQQKMMEWFSDEELVTDSPPVVAAMENAGNPHYLPSPEAHRSIRANELVLLDLWGKLPTDGAVFADITWVGFTGSSVPAEFSSAFGAIRDGRDAAIQLVQASARERRDLRGWQVDRAAREVIERAGYGKAFIHRTGHSLGGTVHGNGVHMDDYETHDDRRLLPGTGFTIEPGVYFDRFGVRTEVNIYYGDGEATVTGPAQTEIVTV
jgi:Xaa-Pro aminopeptidase